MFLSNANFFSASFIENRSSNHANIAGLFLKGGVRGEG